ncbi:unnamed protein product [Caenorhabditis sp. 36 PRJEB53466]|nr:unnamed protein product [Caenorhabditis sp. 36 PRJEB53466]
MNNSKKEDQRYIHIIRIGSLKMDDKWREAAPVNDIEASSWIRIFRAFDTDHDGLIQCEEMQKTIRDSTYSFGFDHYELQKMSLYLEMREGKPVDFADFCYLMSKCKGYRLREYLFKAALTVTPKSQRIAVFSKLQQYKCVPPPLFLILLSIIQLAFYIFYVVDSSEGVWLSGPIPTISPFIVSHYHIAELWRLFTYSLINVGIFHVIFNIIIHLIIGVPLELVHTWRIYVLYAIGVLFGALMSLALDPSVFLMGGAPGSFALIASHITTILTNFKEMENATVRLPLLILFAALDYALAVYQRFFAPRIDKVSMYGHLGGLVAGVLFTFILLRGSKPSRFYTVSFWVSLVLAGFFIAICIALIAAPNLLH